VDAQREEKIFKALCGNGKEKMAKAIVASSNGDGKRNPVVAWWTEFMDFLSDVRGEMRKVVTPSRKEVEATTTVVLIAVMLFGIYFFVCDSIFQVGLRTLINKLSGTH
jgi:preprotein translocase subunit SecE